MFHGKNLPQIEGFNWSGKYSIGRCFGAWLILMLMKFVFSFFGFKKRKKKEKQCPHLNYATSFGRKTRKKEVSRVRFLFEKFEIFF